MVTQMKAIHAPAQSLPAAFLIYPAFFLSGLSALIYQVVWMRMLTFTFGGTVLAVSTTVAAFMAGLALGSEYFGQRADRVLSQRKLYMLLEAAIGLYGLASILILPNLDKLYIPVLQPFSSDLLLLNLVRFVLAFLVVGVGAALMGATLPVISRILIRENTVIGPRFGALYGLNTLGAVCGVLLAGYVLIPALGLWQSIVTAALINLAIAGAFLCLPDRSD